MKHYYILLTMCSIYCATADSQINICDTTTYSAFFLKKNTISPRFECDVYIINKFSLNRFQYLNNEYKNTLIEYAELDSMYSELTSGFIENTQSLTSIYQTQKSEITQMTSTVLPNLKESILDLGQAKESMLLAKNSLDSAIASIKTAKREKWIYAGAGFLIGGLALTILSN